MCKQSFLFLFVFLLFLNYSSRAQNQAEKNNTPNFYLDCGPCDFNFVRQELGFVSFVRDPKLSDVHILMTRSSTGGGGQKYFLNFIGQNLHAVRNLKTHLR